jgi:hypothetical protein
MRIHYASTPRQVDTMRHLDDRRDLVKCLQVSRRCASLEMTLR